MNRIIDCLKRAVAFTGQRSVGHKKQLQTDSGLLRCIRKLNSTVSVLGLLSLVVGAFGLGCKPAVTSKEQSNATQLQPVAAKSPPEPGAPAKTNSTDFNAKLVEATSFTNSGQTASAIAILRPLLIEKPNDATAIFLMARCEASLQNLEATLKLLESIPATHPEAGLAALGMSADCLIQLNRLDDAEAKLRSILEIENRSIAAHRRLAQLLNCQGRRSEAMPHLRALARFQVATSSELYGMNAATDPFVHQDQSESTQIPLSDLCLARLQWFSGKEHEAKSSVIKMLETAPMSTAATAFAGRVFSTLQDEEHFSKWTTQLPRGIDREPEYWFALGNWHQKTGLHDVAIRCFAEAVVRDDTDRFSFLALARSLEAVGREDLSVQAFRRSQMLEEVNYIVTGIERTKEQLRRLVELLRELKRPHEALAWIKLSPDAVELSTSLPEMSSLAGPK